MKEGLVSFVMLTYQSFDGVIDTLASLFEQDYPSIELIISDDGSSNYDEGIAAVKRYVDENRPDSVERVVYNHLEQNQGTVRNANAALRLANGEFVKLLGAGDTFWAKDSLSTYVTRLRESGCLICFSKLVGVTPEGQLVHKLASCADDYDELRAMTPLQLRDRLFARNCLPAPAWIARTELFERYGYFPEVARLIEDYPYWLYLCGKEVRFGFVDDVLIRYRLSGVSSAGSYGKQFMTDMYAIYDQCIFPVDKRFGAAQGVYNALKHAGLNAYTDRARWSEYSVAQKTLAWVRHGIFFAYIDLSNWRVTRKNKMEG